MLVYRVFKNARDEARACCVTTTVMAENSGRRISLYSNFLWIKIYIQHQPVQVSKCMFMFIQTVNVCPRMTIIQFYR